MTKITYNLSAFDPAKAKQGALCVMVLKDYSESTILNTNPSFGGVGICRYKDPGTYLITISSELYKFNEKGNSLDLTSKDYKLLLGEVLLALSGAGGAVESNTRTVVTRSADGTYSSETTEEDNTVLVEGLTVRDNFALNALKTLMQRAEKDPSSLSNNEMSFYCDVAYQWAANMMSAAAKVRATLEDDTSAVASEVSVQSLESNTDKLLNNILVELKNIKHNEGTAASPDYYDKILVKDLATGLTNITNAINSFVTDLNQRLRNIEDSIPSTSGLASETYVDNAIDAVNDRIDSYHPSSNS